MLKFASSLKGMQSGYPDPPQKDAPFLVLDVSLPEWMATSKSTQPSLSLNWSETPKTTSEFQNSSEKSPSGSPPLGDPLGYFICCASTTTGVADSSGRAAKYLVVSL